MTSAISQSAVRALLTRSVGHNDNFPRSDNHDEREIVLCSAVRTAIGAFDGGLKAVPATELGATVVRDVLARSRLKGSDVGTVVMGNVI